MANLTRRIDFECSNCHSLLHTQKLCVVFSKDEELKDKNLIERSLTLPALDVAML